MTTGQLKIHSENILPIIKQWLYSDKDIFVRELVSNACDAIHKLRVLREEGQAAAADDRPTVRITINKNAHTLTFSDDGLGMDAEEIEKYICQLAFSGAEEFVAKYKSNEESDRIIGHFGLGFYSAYMVATRVEIQSLSYKEGAIPVSWSCEGGTEYDLGPGTRTTRGTDIVLHIAKEDEEYLEASRLREILSQYCAFLPYPIYLDDHHINHKEPLWIKSPSECTEKDYLDFYRYLYPHTEDPLFWVHLNVDYPFHLKGILYFPKLDTQPNVQKYTVKLFCNRVFVSENCKDLLPDYLTMLRGVIDSPDIPLNVSRSHLQMDRTVRQLAGHISKKVADSLTVLHRNDKERFFKAWKDISIVIKLGAVEDEKFLEKVRPLLFWKVIGGDWLTAEEYLAKNKEKTKNILFYTTHEKQASHLLNAYQDRQIDVLCTDSPIDPYVINVLEKKLDDGRFQRVDADITESLVDPSREKGILDAEGKTAAGRLADFFRSKLDLNGLQVEAKSLASDSLPALITQDENMRRFQDYLKMTNAAQADLMSASGEHRTLIVNTNNRLLETIMKLDQSKPDLAQALIREVYELALLAQHELKPEALGDFVTRSHHLLETLIDQAIQK
jgi:molecular chaperone HtpG